MNAIAIVRELEARGVRFEAGDSGRLIVDAPKGAIDPEDLERLRSAKSEIFSTLPPRSSTPILDACDLSPDPDIPPEVAAEIRRIEADAYRLGWLRDRPWNRHFWPNTCRHPRGLASIIDPGDYLADVTPTASLSSKKTVGPARGSGGSTDNQSGPGPQAIR